MNLKTLLSAAMLSSSAILAAGCVSGPQQRTGGEVVDDSAITTMVKAALLAEKDVNSFDIHVVTYNSTVQLSGFVESQWQIDKAIQVAANVNGVQHVKSDLVRQPK